MTGSPGALRVFLKCAHPGSNWMASVPFASTLLALPACSSGAAASVQPAVCCRGAGAHNCRAPGCCCSGTHGGSWAAHLILALVVCSTAQSRAKQPTEWNRHPEGNSWGEIQRSAQPGTKVILTNLIRIIFLSFNKKEKETQWSLVSWTQMKCFYSGEISSSFPHIIWPI